MTSPITWDNVTDAFEEIAAQATPAMAQRIFLTIVNGAGLNTANFGGEDADLTRDARILYAAHLETLRRRQGTGLLSSQSEGGAAQSYIYPWMNPRMLHLTTYGMMLIQIIQGTPARAGLVI